METRGLGWENERLRWARLKAKEKDKVQAEEMRNGSEEGEG